MLFHDPLEVVSTVLQIHKKEHQLAEGKTLNLNEKKQLVTSCQPQPYVTLPLWKVLAKAGLVSCLGKSLWFHSGVVLSLHNYNKPLEFDGSKTNRIQ